MSSDVSWIPGIVTTLAGLAAGWFATLWLVRHETPLEDAATRRADLEERFEHLMAQLRELESQRERMEPETYAREKARYEREAADVLRRQEELAATTEARGEAPSTEGSPVTPATESRGSTAPSSPTLTFLASHPRLQGALWASVFFLSLGGLVLWVVASQRPRAPGASITGNAQSTAEAMGSREPASPIPPMLFEALGGTDDLQQLVAAMHEDPNDSQTLIRVERQLILAGRLEGADLVNRRVLEMAPDDPTARVHRALIDGLGGKMHEVTTALAKLTRDHPNVLEGWAALGLIALRAGDAETARRSFEAYVERAPEGTGRTQVRAMLASLGSDRRSAASTPSSSPR